MMNPQQLQSQVGGLYKAIEQVNGHLQRDDVEKRLLDDMDRMKIQMSIKQSKPHQKRFAAGDPLAAQQQQQQQQHLLDQPQRILEHQAQQQPGGGIDEQPSRRSARRRPA
ncbi:hypothetical protein DIPPA_10978 [Diplonema papillatum]|nr:hypothetical protein DIPPA_10978 [Diplonema papillatum]